MSSTSATETPWRVEIPESTGTGRITYHEDGHTVGFQWRHKGADVTMSLWTDRADVWEERNPWAVGRRLEIMRRVTQELIRQKSLTCRIDCDEGDDALSVRLAAGQPRAQA